MALSGTLETFSLPDVLRLLSSTKKTGRLALDGDRGHGCVWVEDGDVVAADADGAVAGDIDGVVFELLRFADASFEFESGSSALDPGDPRPVDGVLAEGEKRLAEWHEIEAVVPSLDIWARMVPELDAEVTVAPGQWRVLAMIGTGVRGHDLAAQMGQGEYDVCRQLRDLVETGLAAVEDGVPEVDVPAERTAPVAAVEPIEPAEVAALGADLASFVAVGNVEPVDAVDDAAEAPAPLVWGLEDGPADVAVAPPDDQAVEPDAVPELDPEAEADFPDLAQLSPKAAAAVEATWSSEPSEAAEPPAEVEVPAEAPAEDDLDQNLLLRFLSSAKQ